MNLKNRLLVLCAAGCLCLASAGCRSISSEHSSGKSGGGGLTYYLPKGRIKVTVAQDLPSADPANMGWRIGVETNAYFEPDLTKKFTLKYHPNALFSDTLKVELTSRELLSKVSLTAEDKTGEVVVKLGELAVEVAKGFAMMSDEGFGAANEAFSTFVDPTSKEDMDRLNQRLKAVHPDLRIDTIPPVTAATKTRIPTRDGIYYRPLQSVTLVMNHQGNKSQEIIFALPNAAPLEFINLRRASFVKQVHSITFEEGLITEFNLEKPSEAFGFITIPVELAKVVVDIPAQMVQMRINKTGASGDLTQKQVDLAEKEAALIKARRELEAEKKGPTE